MNQTHNQSESSSHHSVTSLIQLVKEKDPEAAAEIWNRYLTQLIRLASKKMKGSVRSAADEEDVMISVFDRFFDQAAKGNFKRLDDRNDLWYILVMLTERKIIDRHRRGSAEKRGGGNVIAEIDLEAGSDDRALGLLQQIVQGDRSPEYIVMFDELCTKAINDIDEPIAQRVAEMTLAGLHKKEIAAELDVSVRTIERKLEVIREIWREIFDER